ncbi:hypothetical protein IQ247_03855 [Plectonema cf. radiosum LEGE 06105]|uniref:Uncharacterized protein n=1 Tax=Plectonema cf. radiosum LEGE 06105 TaxID=945769 RepID=A0A8J7JYZ9_9CYAN|nr:hypothetical protein [Plectonema radiosum]MBE9211861.1 hypothetical protein [Plectonema cf. radiosum LEGE 06105]
MANKNSGNFLPLSQGFLSQLIFGVFLTFVFYLYSREWNLSIFLGILGGLGLSLFTTSTKAGPNPETVASSDGIDAGLKYWLFFLLSLIILGYQPETSILLSGLAGLAAGFIFAWWGSKEPTVTKLSNQIQQDEDEVVPSGQRMNLQRSRKSTRRYRRRSGINIKFWER